MQSIMKKDIFYKKLTIGVIMKLSKKSRITLLLLMAATSVCFAQKWKSVVKGTGKSGSQTAQQAEQTETGKTKKRTAKLSNNPTVQKKAAYLTKSEIALNSKDYNAALENYNKAVKVKLPSNVDKSDADILNAWSTEIYARLQYLNVKGKLK